MLCKKCHSDRIHFTTVNQVHLKNKHHGVIYWLFLGWWLKPLLWFLFTIPMLIIKIFRPRKYRTRNKLVTTYTCKD